MATIKVPAIVLGLVAALSAAPVSAQDLPFGAQTPLTAEALGENRGRYAAPTLDGDAVNLSANVADNSVIYFGAGDVLATNTIASGAFTDAAGVLTVVQNTGNNVVIQTGVAVTIEMIQ